MSCWPLIYLIGGQKTETTIDEVIIQMCPFLGAIPKIKRQSFLETTFGFLGSKFASESVWIIS